MARGKIKILRSMEDIVGGKSVKYVARSYKTKRHGKPKSVKSFSEPESARQFAVGNKNIIITKEFR